ncbi:conserved hypothetical protein [Shewanella halifaxensis HAW-EB4]|uniref:Uncharacterized protein n=1 Tax=Shewanella halifaxensis (strain HAW-EB4) TaxID=458817 RepID=B0TPM0_SHEHH|nr:hypothetical protein [Shewanella halifaxensis]ABZ74891.1 conserved hypothetical protein [Shewanella halifaxensis HAW-EB4]
MAIQKIILTSQSLAIIVIMFVSLNVEAVEAEPTINSGHSLSEQAEKTKYRVEQEQLQKARDAAKSREERETKVLERQESGDWEGEQKEKAQKQFKQRGTLQEKYLREAREAASSERKIPKPFNSELLRNK